MANTNPYLAIVLYNDHSFSFSVKTTPAIYTLSLHDALPISPRGPPQRILPQPRLPGQGPDRQGQHQGPLPQGAALPLLDLDRKSTRLNSSHLGISYAVFCLKKKSKNEEPYWKRVFTGFEKSQ